MLQQVSLAGQLCLSCRPSRQVQDQRAESWRVLATRIVNARQIHHLQLLVQVRLLVFLICDNHSLAPREHTIVLGLCVIEVISEFFLDVDMELQNVVDDQ